MNQFFPDYLDENSKGPGVRRATKFLQHMLKFACFNSRIVPDGIYGQQTVEGVKRLQRHLGFRGDDIDGKFGPKTREKLLEKMGVDINAIPEDDFDEETVTTES
ncbi:MAG TPA: peptidoglycan-binding domain-containing protein [Candidatus Andersenbacteria bacterium]|nr:peptidoglycan-binding domain-containing protein [Candidatus Andersenbacteria bacterium]